MANDHSNDKMKSEGKNNCFIGPLMAGVGEDNISKCFL